VKRNKNTSKTSTKMFLLSSLHFHTSTSEPITIISRLFEYFVCHFAVHNYYVIVIIVIRIMSDLMDEKVYLISSAEEGSVCIVTLLLTGRATPNLHNGIVNIGDEEHYVSSPNQKPKVLFN